MKIVTDQIFIHLNYNESLHSFQLASDLHVIFVTFCYYLCL